MHGMVSLLLFSHFLVQLAASLIYSFPLLISIMEAASDPKIHVANHGHVGIRKEHLAG
jgi:hypothetical protein